MLFFISGINLKFLNKIGLQTGKRELQYVQHAKNIHFWKKNILWFVQENECVFYNFIYLFFAIIQNTYI